MELIKAYWIFITTGWKSVKYFPLPENEMMTLIVCLKNNAVMEYNYSNFGHTYWFKHGFGEPKARNPIVFYKPLPSPPKQKDNE